MYLFVTGTYDDMYDKLGLLFLYLWKLFAFCVKSCLLFASVFVICSMSHLYTPSWWLQTTDTHEPINISISESHLLLIAMKLHNHNHNCNCNLKALERHHSNSYMITVLYWQLVTNQD